MMRFLKITGVLLVVWIGAFMLGVLGFLIADRAGYSVDDPTDSIRWIALAVIVILFGPIKRRFPKKGVG